MATYNLSEDQLLTKHQEIMRRQDSAYTSGQDNRERAADDLLFSRLTQWDDTLLGNVLTEYRGEFNLIRKERRRILAEMTANPVSVKFTPDENADQDSADTIMGMYRTDMRDNCSVSAVSIATYDQIDCGMGAWRLSTEYENRHDDLNNSQRITRDFIHNANNRVFFDPNDKSKDKSKSRWVNVMSAYTEEGLKQLAKDEGFDPEGVTDFGKPVDSYVYPWTHDNKRIYVGEVYEKVDKPQTVYIYQNPMGEVKAYDKDKIKDVFEELADAGFEKVGEKKKTRTVIDKYLVSGQRILKGPIRIPGEHLPVIPVYGEWSLVEDVEVYEGITRLAKDPQRLHNFQMSYLVDIVAKGARKKPFFYPEQIKGFEYMYEENGADFNFPYYYLNRVDESGNELPLSPIGYMENPDVPPATAAMIEATKSSVQELIGGGINADMVTGNIAQGTVEALNSRVDMETFIFQDNLATAHRRDGEVYLSMASELYDIPREVVVTGPDGQESRVTVMEKVFDFETGEEVTLNDISNGTFRVSTEVGPAYKTMKDQQKTHLVEMLGAVAPVNPEMANVLVLQIAMMEDGQEAGLIRDYARKQLLVNGLMEPETPEDEQILAQAQQAAQAQAQQPDPMQLAAMAEQMKAQSMMARAQNEQSKIQLQAQKEQVQLQQAQQQLGIDAEQAQADNYKTFTAAELDKARTLEAMSKVESQSAQNFGQSLDNAERLANALSSRFSRVA